MLNNKMQRLIVLALINVILSILVGVLMANGIYAGGLILTIVTATMVIALIASVT